MGDVLQAYRDSLPNTVQGTPDDFVRRAFMYEGVKCTNEFCDDVAMKVSVVNANFYDLDECYPAKHYVKTCRGGCGASYYLNNIQHAPDSMTWHSFYPWDQGIPDSISNKSGRTILSASLMTYVALKVSRMRYVCTLQVPRAVALKIALLWI